MTGVAPAALLDPKLLAGIGDLSLLAKTVVEGFLHGLHRSRNTGLSIDFAEHRSYQPGDDLRRIDWRLFGRTDRFYMKTYEADTNADVIFAVDTSGSMDFGSNGPTKFDYARFLTASLAWLSQRQGDRIGLVTLSDDLDEVIPPSTRHLQLILHTLHRIKAVGPGRLPETLNRAARLRGRSGIVVLVSDCYEDPVLLRRTLGGLRARGHDVLVMHLMDPAERDLPYDGQATFEDAETGVRLPLNPSELRDRYLRLMSDHREALRQGLGAGGIDYLLVETDQPLDGALRTFLDRRLMGSRVR